MRFFREKLVTTDPSKHYTNYLYALNCVDDDVRNQIERAVQGLLWREAETAMQMVVPLTTRPLWRRLLAAAARQLI